MKNGFTLIEILIVMLIISIISGIAMLSIQKNPLKELEYAANGLTDSLKLAATTAMLKPSVLALGLTQEHYFFYEAEESTKKNAVNWTRLTAKYFTGKFPDKIMLELKIQDEEVPLDGRPQIIISQNGDYSPFVLTLKIKNLETVIKISGTSAGTIKNEIIDET